MVYPCSGLKGMFLTSAYLYMYNINRVYFRPVSHYNIIDDTVTNATTFIFLDVLIINTT